MFDIGFAELIFILVITLLVVGPERLPKVARTAGLWLGKLRGFLNTVKADIDKELATEELKRTLSKQAAVPGLEEIIEETRSRLRSDDKPDVTQASETPKAVTGSEEAVAPQEAQDDKQT